MGLIHTTMKEWGAKLPIGLPGKDGKLVKEFKLRPYFTRADRLIGIWREANERGYNEGAMIAADVSKLMSLLILSVGDKQYQLTEKGDSPPESELELIQWHYADVLYSYIYARIEELGPYVYSSVVCPNSVCGFKSPESKFDISEIDIIAVENLEDLSVWVDLQKPFTLRDNTTKCTSLRLGPTEWSVMLRPGMMSGNIAKIQYQSLESSVFGINRDETKKYQMISDEIDQIRKVDRVLLDREADGVSGGVSLALTLECPDCKGDIIDPLNWPREEFFDGSSLSAS